MQNLKSKLLVSLGRIAILLLEMICYIAQRRKHNNSCRACDQGPAAVPDLQKRRRFLLAYQTSFLKQISYNNKAHLSRRRPQQNISSPSHTSTNHNSPAQAPLLTKGKMKQRAGFRSVFWPRILGKGEGGGGGLPNVHSNILYAVSAGLLFGEARKIISKPRLEMYSITFWNSTVTLSCGHEREISPPASPSPPCSDKKTWFIGRMKEQAYLILIYLIMYDNAGSV